jgi:hypothetical protein
MDWFKKKTGLLNEDLEEQQDSEWMKNIFFSILALTRQKAKLAQFRL